VNAAGAPASAAVSSKAKIVLALGTVYLVWGSTYLGIRWVVEELPPLLSGAMRFSVAGLGFLLIARAAGPLSWSRAELRNAALLGVVMPGMSNGLVCLAERRIPSALTALILAVVPLWIALFQALRPSQPRSDRRATAGLLIGFAGTALLVWTGGGGQAPSLLGMTMIVAASLLWAGGTLFAREARRPRPWMASAGVEMLAGGLFQAVLGLAAGDFPRLLASSPGPRAIGSLVYLTVIGAWAGYGAFSWLTSRAPPTLIATYSYVNPLVAVFLGWSLASEPLTGRTLVAGALIVCSVVLVTAAHRRASDR
jgi:drug/metabolite transporter (DMT)-like permease